MSLFRRLFYMHGSDRRILLVLVVLAVVVTGGLWFAGGMSESTGFTHEDSLAMARRDSSRNWYSDSPGYCRYEGNGRGGRGGYSRGGRKYPPKPQVRYATDGKRYELFPFDPNTADSTQLLRLGLSSWQVRNIYRYRAGGGVYREPSDFARLYGLTQGRYEELEPYITIGESYCPASEKYGKTNIDTLQHPRKLSSGQTVSLATADTTQLKRIPGIGSYYARKISEYGKRLGGYAAVEQILEVDGVPAEAMDYVTVNPASIKRINVNKADYATLVRHPYLSPMQVRAIMDHRRLRGNLRQLSELRLMPAFHNYDFQRIEPYIEY